MSNSDKYVKAKDLKIGDVFFTSQNGAISFSEKIFSIELIEYAGGKYLTFNNRYVLKQNGSKGLYFHDKYRLSDMLSKLHDDDISVSEKIYTPDKRIATTHAVNYWNSRVEDYKKRILSDTESISDISKKIATLRFDEFNLNDI